MWRLRSGRSMPICRTAERHAIPRTTTSRSIRILIMLHGRENVHSLAAIRNMLGNLRLKLKNNEDCGKKKLFLCSKEKISIVKDNYDRVAIGYFCLSS